MGQYPVTSRRMGKLSMVIDGNKLICYKNGEKTVEETFSAPIAVGTGDLTLGANPNWVDGEKFQGMITDVRIWTVARTEEEIKSDLNYYFASKKRTSFLTGTCRREKARH